HVGPVLERGGDRLLAVPGLGHHRDAGRVQDQPEPAAYQLLVVGNDHAGCLLGLVGRAHDVAAWTPAGIAACPSATGSSRILALIRQPPPGRGPASNSPWYRAIRSRRPISPRPPGPGGWPHAAPGPAGRPSSETLMSSSRGRYSTWTTVRAGPACLSTLVSASWMTR